MATFFGLIDQNGEPKVEGSGNWQSESRGTGLTIVTLSGASSQPVPVLVPASNDLTSYQTGVENFINITDIGEDDNGRWYFGVATNDAGGNLTARSFSFVAETA